jgi:FixJ family two-component response regulator
MSERGIIIADRDTDYRQEVAEFFRKQGYQVETTDSAIHVLCSILQKQTPVVLLGCDFDSKVSSADLIHLLKRCNRHLEVIMVSEELPLPLLRSIRQEGIFFHSLKNELPGDNEELGQAVKCAFDKQMPANHVTESEPVPVAVVTAETGQAEYARDYPLFTWLENNLRTTRMIIGLLTLVCSAIILFFALSLNGAIAGNVAVWLFFGFCALIIVGQLLPLFRTESDTITAEQLHPLAAAGEALQQDAEYRTRKMTKGHPDIKQPH